MTNLDSKYNTFSEETHTYYQEIKDDIQFLLENDVRFAIFDTINIFKQPLSVKNIALLKRYPSTTIIHHIPLMLELKVISAQKLPKKSGKYYSVTEKFLPLTKLRFDSLMVDIERLLGQLENRKNLSMQEFRIERILEMKKILDPKIFDILAETIKSAGIFNKSMTNITAEYLKYTMKNLEDKKKINMPLPIAEVFFEQISLAFSNVNQYIEYQKLYLSFIRDLGILQKKISEENSKIEENDLEKAYFYFFTAPIVNISEND